MGNYVQVILNICVSLYMLPFYEGQCTPEHIAALDTVKGLLACCDVAYTKPKHCAKGFNETTYGPRLDFCRHAHAKMDFAASTRVGEASKNQTPIVKGGTPCPYAKSTAMSQLLSNPAPCALAAPLHTLLINEKCAPPEAPLTRLTIVNTVHNFKQQKWQ